MADTAPLARSPIAPVGAVTEIGGWLIPTATASSALALSDWSSLAKVGVRADRSGGMAEHLGVAHGQTASPRPDRLVIGSGPGEWLILGGVGTASDIVSELRAVVDEGLVSVVDLTHGRALVHLAGPGAPAALAKVCAIDLSDRVTPPGSALRTSVASVVTDLVRLDGGGDPAYLLHCERSTGQFLFDALLEAGRDLGCSVAGMPHPGALA